jgi:hypothetical protein
VECLPSKLKVLSSTTSTAKKKKKDKENPAKDKKHFICKGKPIQIYQQISQQKP